jgi:hypothetical protein
MSADEPAPAAGDLTRRELLAAGAVGTAAGIVGAAASGDSAAAAPPRVARAASTPSPRLDMVCRDCGGNNVTRDGWARWDVEAQDWVLGSFFDYAFCHDCEEETRLEEVQLGVSSPSGGS